jgi:hypothetical protein
MTLNVLSEINLEIRTLFNNIDQTLIYSFDNYKNELTEKVVILNSLNEFFKQENKVLMMIYLLKISICERDHEDFAKITETLYYLSHIQEFRVALISTLEKVSRASRKKSCESQQNPELADLFIVDTQFFEVSVSTSGKLYYLGFLSNMFTANDPVYTQLFEQHLKLIKSHLVSLINWADLQQSIEG